MNERNPGAKVAEFEPYRGPRTIPRSLHTLYFSILATLLVNILLLKINKPMKTKDK